MATMLSGTGFGRLHRCDDGCACPIHGAALIYWPTGDDHACQDVDCRYGHGMNEILWREALADRRRGY